MRVRLANGPVSWGVDFADAEGNPPWSEVLDGIADAGYSWTELGPLGYLPRDPTTLRDELSRRGLSVAGSFIFQPLHRRAEAKRIAEVTRDTCALIRAAGGSHLVVIDLLDEQRIQTAGRSEVAPRLGPAGWRTLVDAIREVSGIAAEEFGLRAVAHPHAGTYIEFEDEIDLLLDALPPELCGLCLDTGHAAYAGIDPVSLYRRHRDRTHYLHFKDVLPAVRREAVAGGWDFWKAIEAGIFCPVGRGVVDFPTLAVELGRTGFDGWATVEQDRTQSSPRSAVEDAVASREYLEQVGFGEVKASVPS